MEKIYRRKKFTEYKIYRGKKFTEEKIYRGTKPVLRMVLVLDGNSEHVAHA